ncbi:MAG: glycosyltransferase [Bacteriovoracaceae bacterium]|jgi:glycosyltransferase involved in cell wall biosynthesis|nr:glycosyltransferase [Bacteriovoracaceae bacterium]
MNKTKNVTIIIPTFNCEDFIEETISSCLNQTYKNLKILVVDDCSTDNTLSVLDRFKNNEKVKVIKNSMNKGLPKNINDNMLLDDSDFFIYLGHDDILPKDHVHLMLTKFNDEKVVAVHCNSMAINTAGEELGFTRDDDTQIIKSSRTVYNLSLYNYISIIGMMHRTRAFKTVGGWDESYDLYGEWLYYIKLAGAGDIVYSKDTYAYYRKHETNISKTLYKKERLKTFYAYTKRCRLEAFSRTSDKSIYDVINFLYYYILSYARFLKKFFGL